MSESKPQRHPLFDPASMYSRMRKSVRPEYKMRGYFYWQKARAIRIGIPLPGREPEGEERRQSELRNLACRIAGVRCGVLTLAVLPDARLASGSEDGTVRFWDVRKNQALALPDATGDQISNLIAANYNDGTVSELPSRSLGIFEPQMVFPVGDKPISLVAGDFNGDGRIDLATINFDGKSVSVLLGTGDGTFEPGQTVAVGPAAAYLVAGDFNGDGCLDLVTANEASNDVTVLLGNGDGTFSTQHTFAVGSQPRWLAVADINGDGNLDLVVANYNDNSVSVLLGRGDGTFEPQMVFPVGDKPSSLVVADFNDDGKPDLLVANAAGDIVSILLGDGDGTFESPQTFQVGSLAMTVLPDGRLACGSADGTVCIWDLHKNESLTLKGHTDGVRALAVLPDGRLVSGSADGTARIWDLASGKSQIVGEHGPDFRVTDAVNVRPVELRPGRWFPEEGVGSVILVCEADGTRSVGMWVRLPAMERLSCRAFLIEPEVLARLQDVVQKVCAVGPDNALVHAFAAETVASHMDVARLLSAIPDLDGEVKDGEIRFHRLAIANEFDTFPPRQGPLTVVLVFDD